MNVVVPISIICFFLAIQASRNRLKSGLELSFIALTVIGAIHYDYGNDYTNYLYKFNESKDLSFGMDDIINFFRDPGWIVLCILFRPLGFFSMVIFLNIFQNLVYYGLIKTLVKREWWWLAVFIYIFSTNLYLINFSLMRQGLAITLIISSVYLILS